MTGEAGKKRRMVFITARVHPGESPASLVCQGKDKSVLIISSYKSEYL